MNYGNTYDVMIYKGDVYSDSYTYAINVTSAVLFIK